MVPQDIQISAIRALYECGDPGPLAALLDPDVQLQSWLPGDPVKVSGRDRAIAVLSAARPVAGSSGVHWLRGGPVVDMDGCRHRHVLLGDEMVDEHLVLPEKPEPGEHLGPLVPGILRGATGREVVAHNGVTQSRLERAVLADGRLVVVKRSSPALDFFARNNGDQGREVMLWRDGAVEGLDSELVWPVLDAGFDTDGGWAVVMDDVTDHLVTNGAPFGPDEFSRVAAALTALHDRHDGTAKPAYVMSMSERLRLFSPALYDTESSSIDFAPRQITIGVLRLLDHLPGELAAAVDAIQADPTPLERALVADGATLLHGDVNPRNLALRPGRVDLFDWGLATWGPPDVDAGWFIAMAPLGRSENREDGLVERWRRVRGDRFDEAAFDRALIATFCTICFGWGWLGITLRNPAMITAMEWWTRRFERALETWSPV